MLPFLLLCFMIIQQAVFTFMTIYIMWPFIDQCQISNLNGLCIDWPSPFEMLKPMLCVPFLLFTCYHTTRINLHIRAHLIDCPWALHNKLLNKIYPARPSLCPSDYHPCYRPVGDVLCQEYVWYCPHQLNLPPSFWCLFPSRPSLLPQLQNDYYIYTYVTLGECTIIILISCPAFDMTRNANSFMSVHDSMNLMLIFTVYKDMKKNQVLCGHLVRVTGQCNFSATLWLESVIPLDLA